MSSGRLDDLQRFYAAIHSLEKKLGGARLPFYEAIVANPKTGKPLSLELHTDLDERVQTVVRFSAHPEEFRQHWG